MKPETRRVKNLFRAYAEIKETEHTLKGGARGDIFLTTIDDKKVIKHEEADGVNLIMVR